MALNKPNETTPNQLKHEHKKARIEQERDEMFLATGGSLPSSAASNFFKNGQTVNGFSVSGRKDMTYMSSNKIPTNDNPVYRMQERYLKELSDDYQTAEAAEVLTPGFDGPDASRERIDVRLRRVATADQPTDIQFHPVDGRMVVLEKEGAVRWFDLDANTEGTWATLDVLTEADGTAVTQDLGTPWGGVAR